MKKKTLKIVSVFGAMMLTLGAFTGCGTKKESEEPKTEEKFIPALSTEKTVDLDIAGFMGNFEALDQVVNDFNEYYPNVTIHYEKCVAGELKKYLDNNKNVDIFMTSDKSIRDAGQTDAYVFDKCINLADENIDTSVIDKDLLQACTVDDTLARIPLSRTMCGMAVNKSLLEKEGLNIPKNYKEFMEVCEKLKAKGYTPIQSARNHVCSDMILPMALSILGKDETLTEMVNSSNMEYVEKLRPVYEKLYEIVDKGYMSNEINAEYPDDNYDGAILKFFEGDVPFWICNTESFSGMKKRESKSETFKNSPFEYTFMGVPLDDKGVYDYEEPWYGFSVSKDSDEIEYAVEFIKFLCMEQELDKIAEIKGMPSVTNRNSDVRFIETINPSNAVSRYIYDGKLDNSVNDKIATAGNKLGTGELQSVGEALKSFND